MKIINFGHLWALLCVWFIPTVGLGAPLEVTCPDMFERFSEEVPDGGSGKVVVYLQSAGDVLGGIPVAIVDVATGTTIGEKKAKADGIVVFDDLGPGKYNVKMTLSKEKRKRTTAQIGDIRVIVARPRGKSDSVQSKDK